MNKVTISPKNYYGWAGYCLSNGEIEIGITPSIGGRIISLCYQQEELLYVDKNRLGETFELGVIDDLSTFKKNFGFRLWGGDKTWVAPEQSWVAGIPPLHLDAGQYTTQLDEKSITMTSPLDQETGLQITRKVTLQSGGEITLTQQFTNQSNKIILCGIWDVTQLLRPFRIYFPARKEQVKPDTRFAASLGNQHELLTTVAKDWVEIRCEKPLQFKYSFDIERGIAIALKEQADHFIAMIRYFKVNPKANYPQAGIVEVYNSDNYPYLELEVLSPSAELSHHDNIIHQQTWILKRFPKTMTIETILSSVVES
ncbi:MAG: hypothetical protein A2X77_04235 [Gammaproteobacteria bacterium GWE2_42_36]|nr:MAG: hypothetical protein A2X77_04235 [Gammaproteobacteria bacterium GWE2_42_36]HCU05328.1 hypothetical protein [Coxiellaceae bacterium]